jgi:hypothetical protein
VKSHTPPLFKILHLGINIILFVLICWQILFGPFFQIKTIYLKGDPNVIYNLAAFKTNENLILFSSQNFIRKIKQQIPFIKSANVYKNFPSSLTVEVIDRKPIFYSTYENQTIFIDEEGKILPNLKIWDNVSKTKLNCEIKIDKNTDSVSDADLIKQFMTVFRLIDETSWTVDDFTCINKNENKMTVENIEIIYLSSIDANNLISSLQVLFKQFRIEGKQPVRIDLRFSKPVVQYKSENLNSASPSGNN